MVSVGYNYYQKSYDLKKQNMEIIPETAHLKVLRQQHEQAMAALKIDDSYTPMNYGRTNTKKSKNKLIMYESKSQSKTNQNSI